MIFSRYLSLKFWLRHNKKVFLTKLIRSRVCSDRRNGTAEWVNTLIDSVDTLKELRKKELHWMYKLKAYARSGLNNREVSDSFYRVKIISSMFAIYNKVTSRSLIMNALYLHYIIFCVSNALFSFFFSCLSSSFIFNPSNFLFFLLSFFHLSIAF